MNLLQRRQILIFSVGWISYASTYLLRKPLGIIKTDLVRDLNFTKAQLGWLDTALLLPYACIQIFLGSLGDKLGSRFTMSMAMIISGLSMVTFAQWNNFYILFALLAINGSAQGLCWPNICKVLASWYPDKSRSSIFGIFGTSAFAGGMIGTILAVYLQISYGWRFVYLLPSLILCFLGFLTYMLFYKPDELGITVPGKEQSTIPQNKGVKLSFMELWRIPLVFEIAIAMFCLKLVRYCMYMWLPLYLLEYLRYTKAQAGWLSTTFEVGGVIGSALLGIVIDRVLGGRTLSGTTISAAGSTISLFFFMGTSEWGIVPNCFFMAVAGALNCGPDTILGGSLPSEIGEMNGLNAAAAVTGLVNGFGSIGSCLEGPIIGIVSQYYGWSGMFYLMIVLSAVATLASYRANLIYTKQNQSILLT